MTIEFDAEDHYSNLRTYEYTIITNASGLVMTWPIEIEVAFDCANSPPTAKTTVPGNDIKSVNGKPTLVVNIDIAVDYFASTHTFFETQDPTICPLS